MHALEFLTIQRELNLTNQELEDMLGVSDQTIVNWRHGYTRIPRSVALIMRLLRDNVESRGKLLSEPREAR